MIKYLKLAAILLMLAFLLFFGSHLNIGDAFLCIMLLTGLVALPIKSRDKPACKVCGIVDCPFNEVHPASNSKDEVPE